MIGKIVAELMDGILLDLNILIKRIFLLQYPLIMLPQLVSLLLAASVCIASAVRTGVRRMLSAWDV